MLARDRVGAGQQGGWVLVAAVVGVGLSVVSLIWHLRCWTFDGRVAAHLDY